MRGEWRQGEVMEHGISIFRAGGRAGGQARQAQAGVYRCLGSLPLIYSRKVCPIHFSLAVIHGRCLVLGSVINLRRLDD